MGVRKKRNATAAEQTLDQAFKDFLEDHVVEEANAYAKAVDVYEHFSTCCAICHQVSYADFNQMMVGAGFDYVTLIGSNARPAAFWVDCSFSRQCVDQPIPQVTALKAGTGKLPRSARQRRAEG